MPYNLLYPLLSRSSVWSLPLSRVSYHCRPSTTDLRHNDFGSSTPVHRFRPWCLSWQIYSKSVFTLPRRRPLWYPLFLFSLLSYTEEGTRMEGRKMIIGSNQFWWPSGLWSPLSFYIKGRYILSWSLSVPNLDSGWLDSFTNRIYESQ